MVCLKESEKRACRYRPALQWQLLRRSPEIFLYTIASRLERLCCGGRNVAMLSKVFFHFPRLLALTIEVGGQMTSKSLEVLLSRYSPTLKRLKLDHCYMFNSSSSTSLLPDLQMLSLRHSLMESAFLCRLISSSPSLRSFYCEHLGSGSCLSALATHCPLLQVLAYDISGSQALNMVLTACSKLEVVMFKCIGPEEQSLAVLQQCGRLKAICMMGEHLETSPECAAALQARLASLKHLSLFECMFSSDGPLLALAPHCGNLRTLELENLGTAVSQEALIALLRNLTNVVELNLHGACLGDQLLEAIAVHCSALEALHLTSAVGYTEDGILTIAKGCAGLKRLYLNSEERIVTSIAIKLWQALRPGLRVDYDVEDSAFWTSLANIEGTEVAAW